MATAEAMCMSKIDEIIKSAERLEDFEIVVGYQGKNAQQPALKVDPDGGKTPQPINMATLAAIHNFGTGTIPARPYMSLGFMAALPEVQKRMTVIAKKVNDGQASLQKELQVVGAVVQNEMRKALEGLKGNAQYQLSEATKKARQQRRGARKGDNASPLIDTGRLRQSLSFAVRKRGSEG